MFDLAIDLLLLYLQLVLIALIIAGLLFVYKCIIFKIAGEWYDLYE